MSNFCPSCGVKAVPGDQFCTGCGKPLILTRKVASKQEHVEYTECSPMAVREFPPGIKRWNWAAFWFGWIWALARGLYPVAIIWLVLYVLMGVAWLLIWIWAPVALILYFVAGAKGYEWDWRHNYYQSVEEFFSSYRRWSIALRILWYTLLISVLLAIVAGTWLAVLQK